MTEITHSGNWEKIFENWKLFSPPARPDEEVCRIVGKAADEVLSLASPAGPPRILILGSTPEYRDLAYQFYLLYGAETICVDMSADNYRAMTGFTRHQNTNERFLGANWFHLEYDNWADIVLSDAAMSNIPLRQREEFYRLIRRALKSQGRFIAREDVLTKTLEIYRYKKLEEVLGEYAQKVVDNELQLIPAMNVAGELWLRISAMNRKYRAEHAHFAEEAEQLPDILLERNTPRAG